MAQLLAANGHDVAVMSDLSGFTMLMHDLALCGFQCFEAVG